MESYCKSLSSTQSLYGMLCCDACFTKHGSVCFGADTNDITSTSMNTKQTPGSSAIGTLRTASSGHLLFLLQVVSDILGQRQVICMYQLGSAY